MHHLRSLGFIFLLLPSVLRPQEPAGSQPIPSGTAVRLTWAENQREAAVLLAPLDATTETLRYCQYPAPACLTYAPSDTLQRPIADLRFVEIRHGNQAKRGAIIGAAAGAGGTVLVILGTAEARPAGQTGRAVFTVLAYGAIWGALGALIGSGFDQWIPAP